MMQLMTMTQSSGYKMGKKYLVVGGIFVIVLSCFIYSFYNQYDIEQKEKNAEILYLMETHAHFLSEGLEKDLKEQKNITEMYTTYYVKNLYYFDAYAKVSDDENWKLIAKCLVHFAEQDNFKKLSIEDIKVISNFLNWALDADLSSTDALNKIDDFYEYLHNIYYE